MSMKRHTPEETVAKLRQVKVLTAQGTSVADAVRAIGVTEVASETSCIQVCLQHHRRRRFGHPDGSGTGRHLVCGSALNRGPRVLRA